MLHVIRPPALLASVLLALAAISGPSLAANEPSDPLMASPSVSVDGQPVVRQGDRGGGTIVRDGSHNVFINGKPAATVGSQSECGGTIVTGSSSVFVNGKPVATGTSRMTPCPR